MPKYLRSTKDGHVYLRTADLAKREDMEPYELPVVAEKPAAEPVAQEPSVPQPGDEDFIGPMPEDLSALHWKTLEKRVLAAGGQYESKEQAVAFLKEVDA